MSFKVEELRRSVSQVLGVSALGCASQPLSQQF